MQQIIVSISADGDVQVEAKGVRGPGCAKLTEAIEKALGEVTKDQKKPEFSLSPTIGAKQNA